jgi:hypothetical protein
MPRKYIDRQNNAKKSSAPISTQAQIKKPLTSDMGSGIAVWFDKSTFWHGTNINFKN